MSSDIIAHLVKLANDTRFPTGYRRLRIAVTAEEYAAVRRYFLEKDGKFHGRIMNIPLVVELAPSDPPMLSEFPHNET